VEPCAVSSTPADSYDLILYNVETFEQRDQYFRISRRERVDGALIASLTRAMAM
jgi:hypothetical protein